MEYQYQGVDRSGKKVTGKIEAPNEGELRILLRGQGIRPIRITMAGAQSRDLSRLFTKGGSSSGGATPSSGGGSPGATSTTSTSGPSSGGAGLVAFCQQNPGAC